MSVKGSKWRKHASAEDDILTLLSDVKGFLTTNAIKDKLQADYNTKVSNPTLKRYLSELKKAGQIIGFESESTNTICMWGISNGPTAQ